MSSIRVSFEDEVGPIIFRVQIYNVIYYEYLYNEMHLL